MTNNTNTKPARTLIAEFIDGVKVYVDRHDVPQCTEHGIDADCAHIRDLDGGNCN